MNLDEQEYIDEAIKDTKVCPMVKDEIETNPKIRGEYIIQKTVKFLLKDRFSTQCAPVKLFNIISNKLNDKEANS